MFSDGDGGGGGGMAIVLVDSAGGCISPKFSRETSEENNGGGINERTIPRAGQPRGRGAVVVHSPLPADGRDGGTLRRRQVDQAREAHAQIDGGGGGEERAREKGPSARLPHHQVLEPLEGGRVRRPDEDESIAPR